MKRIIATLLCLSLSLFAAIPALGEGARGRVVDCEEWVSLRAAPDTSAQRLAQVPLGAEVTEVALAGNGFAACVYEGQAGYILAEYLAVEQSAAASMYVVNCEEWVSLRAAPDTSAERLAKVPLGAEVTGCVSAANGFIACSYAGQAGYILDDHLSDSRVGGRYDRTLADEPFAGARVVIEAGVTAAGEAVRASAYAEDGALLWRRELATGQRTELTLVDGFFGGTEKRPLVYLYAMGDGLTAYYAASGEAAWRVPTDAVNLGGSITHAVDADGTIYVGGYYGPEPVAISSAGEVLWQARTSDDIYWLTDIQVTDEGVLAAYEVVGFEGNDMRPGTVLYDRETGKTLRVEVG